MPPDESHRHSSLRSVLSGARAPPLCTTSRHYMAHSLHRQPPDPSRAAISRRPWWSVSEVARSVGGRPAESGWAGIGRRQPRAASTGAPEASPRWPARRSGPTGRQRWRGPARASDSIGPGARTGQGRQQGGRQRAGPFPTDPYRAFLDRDARRRRGLDSSRRQQGQQWTGSQRSSAAVWNRAACRVRRWEMPTTFLRPDGDLARPKPGEAHPSRPGARAASLPAIPCAGPAPTRSTAAAQASPTHQAARRTSASQSGSPAGMIRSIQSTASGSTSTAPPPLPRRATVTPAAAAAPGSTSDSGWPLPSTRAGWSTCRIRARRAGVAAARRRRPAAAASPSRRRRAEPLLVAPRARRPGREVSSGQAGGPRPEVRLPVGADGAGGHQDPGPLAGRHRAAAEPHAAVLEQPVSLSGIARVGTRPPRCPTRAVPPCSGGSRGRCSPPTPRSTGIDGRHERTRPAG